MDESEYEKEQNRERREQLANARASRSRRRKDRVDGPQQGKERKKGLKKLEAETRVAHQIVKQLAIKLSGREFAKARSMIDDVFDGQESQHISASLFWKKITESDSKFSVRRHNAQYTVAIARALAVIEYVAANVMEAEVHVALVAEKVGIAVTAKRFDPIKAMLQLVIDYRLTDDSSKIDAHDLSRDAMAVRYLISQGIRSFDLEAHQKKYGGGVDKWSRLGSRNATTAAEELRDRRKATEEDIDRVLDEREEANKYYDDVPPDSGQAVPDDEVTDEQLATAAKQRRRSEYRCSLPDLCMGNNLAERCSLEWDETMVVLFRGTRRGTASPSTAITFRPKGPPGRRRAFGARLLEELRQASKKAGSKTRRFDLS